MKHDNKYTKMQQAQYDHEASIWSPTNRDPVVGSFDKHNAWQDYSDYLFKGINTQDKVALDFGCGPGRCIAQFANRFKHIDGTDLSQINLNNAKLWCSGKASFTPTFYKASGIDIAAVPSITYDVVYSTICMQHICVYDIRLSLMKEFHRVLKQGGSLCLQMGFGPGHPSTVGYYENYYDATATNSGKDTRVDDPEQLRKDLESIGFANFTFDIRPVGPGDAHGNWIFFRATKS